MNFESFLALSSASSCKVRLFWGEKSLEPVTAGENLLVRSEEIFFFLGFGLLEVRRGSVVGGGGLTPLSEDTLRSSLATIGFS